MTLLVTILSEMNIFPMKTFWQIESKIVKLSFSNANFSQKEFLVIRTRRTRISGCHSMVTHSTASLNVWGGALHLAGSCFSAISCIPPVFQYTCCCTRRLTTVLGKDLSEDSENLVSNKDAAAPPSHHCYCLSRTSTPWLWRGFVAKSTFFDLFFDFILTPNQRLLRITLQLLPHLSWQHSLAFQQRQGFLRIESVICLRLWIQFFRLCWKYLLPIPSQPLMWARALEQPLVSRRMGIGRLQSQRLLQGKLFVCNLLLLLFLLLLLLLLLLSFEYLPYDFHCTGKASLATLYPKRSRGSRGSLAGASWAWCVHIIYSKSRPALWAVNFHQVLYPNVFEYRRRRRRETPSERRARAAAEGLSISRRQTREKASKSKIKIE